MREIKLMKVRFEGGAEKTIRGVFYPERRMIYEVDENGNTVAIYNFDYVREMEIRQDGRMSIKLVG